MEIVNVAKGQHSTSFLLLCILARTGELIELITDSPQNASIIFFLQHDGMATQTPAFGVEAVRVISAVPEMCP